MTSINMADMLAKIKAKEAAAKHLPSTKPIEIIPLEVNGAVPSIAERLAALRSGKIHLPPTPPLTTPELEEQHEEIIEQAAIQSPASTDFIATRLAQLRAGRIKTNPAPLKPEFTEPLTINPTVKPDLLKPPVMQTTGMSGELITYNPNQQKFIETAARGESCVLIGAAGTGKTTCSQGGMQALIQSGNIPTLQSDGHTHLVGGTPGIIIVSFTRRAVNNIRKVQSDDLKSNCITVHKLLEYQPEYFEIVDPETGDQRNTMRFVPNRNETNPLPPSIHTIVVEEASMLGTDLFNELLAALPHDVQWIFIGDIQQLPPVFGPAILGFKMLELPVIELTEVYRQALKSPIIRLAHRILSGKPIPEDEYPEWEFKGQLKIHKWKKKLSPDMAIRTLGAFFTRAVDKEHYNPDEDIILIPFNKSCGTIELNSLIANHLARKRNEMTYEVIAGYNKHYFSPGDNILFDREDANIVEIAPNPGYAGARPQAASRTLDYWGYNPNIAEENPFADYGEDDVDFLLAQIGSSEDKVNQASHKFMIQLKDTGATVELTKSAEINSLLHSYALTVHKSQGSEWRKVFVCLHQSHATMVFRELLYTAVTRAREDLFVICEPESFTKGITTQRIKGNTLAEKAEFFKGKQKPNIAPGGTP